MYFFLEKPEGMSGNQIQGLPLIKTTKNEMIGLVFEQYFEWSFYVIWDKSIKQK